MIHADQIYVINRKGEFISVNSEHVRIVKMWMDEGLPEIEWFKRSITMRDMLLAGF